MLRSCWERIVVFLTKLLSCADGLVCVCVCEPRVSLAVCALRVYAYVCAYPSLPDLTKSNRSELENFKGNSKKVNTFFLECCTHC